MYEPPLHRQDDLAAQHALIRRHPLGLLVSHGPQGLVANAIPFLIDAGASKFGTLQRPYGARQRAMARSCRRGRGAGGVPRARPLRLAVLVRDQARGRQGRADVELRDGSGARRRARDRGRGVASPADHGADAVPGIVSARALGGRPTRRRISSPRW